jgi:hypothetical protein
MDKILQQASQKTVKIERKAPRPSPGTLWPWTKTETIEESEPVIEIEAESKQVSERGIVNVELGRRLFLLRGLQAGSYTTAAKTYTRCYLKQEIEA